MFHTGFFRMRWMVGAALLAVFAGCSNLQAPDRSTAASDQKAVAAVLDALHQRASAADFEGYFSLYREDAVFYGTDRDEYWSLARFKSYARPRFATGTGWSYTPIERFVHLYADVAWFEERLQNAALGQTRGTGVLVRERGRWRVAQYNLTLPIPNELIDPVAERIRTHYAR